MLRLISLTCLMGLAVPAIAAEDAPKAERAETKIICKTEASTGTRFKKKICHSAREWDKIGEEHRRAAEEMAGPTVNTARGN